MAQKANLSPRQPIQIAPPMLTSPSRGVANIPDQASLLVQSGPNGPPLSAVFERLKQLKIWQQQQQETLLRQQQEQLLKLRNEQDDQRSHFVRGPSENVVGTTERTQPYMNNAPPLPTQSLPKSESKNLGFLTEMNLPSMNERQVFSTVSGKPPTSKGSDELWEAGIDCDEVGYNEEVCSGDVTLEDEDDRAIEYCEQTVSTSPVSYFELNSRFVYLCLI